MSYEDAGDLARQARGIAEDVFETLERGKLLSFGNAALAPLGSLATSIEVLARAVEQLADMPHNWPGRAGDRDAE